MDYCREHGINVSDGQMVQKSARQIWVRLEESGKLHPEMTFEGFLEGIRAGLLIAAIREGHSQWWKIKVNV